ncbi:ankyrin repeat protein [Spatholobus suberectus]|nr:ankyrin repeat protein [Spatholobus suberectus]
MDGRSLPTSVVTRSGSQHGHWMEQRRGSLMVVATVIATMTFQIAINPPGGVWQSKAGSKEGCAPGKICEAGTSVLAFGGENHQQLKYEIFILLCTISFSASLTTILLLICGIPLRNKCFTWLLIIVMCISVICTAGAYVICILMVLNPHDDDTTINGITQIYALFWGGLTVLVCLVLFCRFVFWLLKLFFRLLCCCCSRVKPSTENHLV